TADGPAPPAEALPPWPSGPGILVSRRNPGHAPRSPSPPCPARGRPAPGRRPAPEPGRLPARPGGARPRPLRRAPTRSSEPGRARAGSPVADVYEGGPPAVKRATALYARVSTAQQEKNGTIASQLAALDGYAAAHGLGIAPEHRYADDGYSGARLDRP